MFTNWHVLQVIQVFLPVDKHFIPDTMFHENNYGPKLEFWLPGATCWNTTTCWAFTEQCWFGGTETGHAQVLSIHATFCCAALEDKAGQSGGLATGCPCRTRVATGPAYWVQQTWRTRLKWWSRGSRPRIVKKQGSCTTARGKKIPLIMICHFVLCVSENRDGLELPDFWFLVVFSFLTCSVGWTFHYWWIHQFLSVRAKYYLDCIYMKSSFSFSAPILYHLVICPQRNF